MKKLLLLICVTMLGFTVRTTMAQCGNDNFIVPGDLTPAGAGLSVTQTYGAGQYVTAYVYAGANYSASTCGTSAFDTQLTVFDDASGAFIAYNDDACGLQTNLSFTAATCGYVRILLDQYSCNNSGLTTPVIFTQNTASAAINDSIACAPDTTVYTTAGICSATGITLTPPYAECLRLNGNDAPAAFPLGNTMVTWTALDHTGLTVSCMQQVMVIDSTPPEPSCLPDDTLVSAAGLCGIPSNTLAIPAGTDNCGIDTVYHNAPALVPVGTNTITWTFADGSGNTASCTQNIIVTDNENPAIVCPANVSVNTDAGSCTASGVALGTPITSDNCTVASVTNNAPATFPLGATTVTWTVTDAAGNTASCTQNVMVTDNQNPAIVCPANVSVDTDAGSCTASGVALGTPVTSDNCTVASVTNDAPAAFPTGSTTVTWTVTDAAGHTASCTQNVMVTDNESPTIVCPANVNVSADSALCTTTGVILGTPVTSDNCSVASVTNDAPAAYAVGTTTVTWMVTDGAGNTTTCMQLITVTDTQAPVIVCPSDTLIGNDSGSCSASIVSLGVPVASDNCGIAGITNDAGTSLLVGSNTVIWTVTDVNGLTGTCTQNVTVADNEFPVIVCQGDTTVAPSLNNCLATVNWTSPVITDNCGIDSVYSTHTTADTLSGITTIMYTVVDLWGNTSTCSFTVTVNNDLTILTDSITDLSCNAGSSGAVAVTVTGGATPYTYDWSNDGSGDFDDSGDLSGLPAGSYVLNVKDSLNCTATTSVTLTEPAALDLTMFITPQSASTPNGAIDLTVSGGVSPYTFDWSNDGTGDFDDSEDLGSLTAGTYFVVVNDANGCSANTDAIVASTTGIGENVAANAARVYPNPGNGIFVLELNNYTGEHTVVEIRNMLGEMVYTSPVYQARTAIDLSASNGLMTIRILQNNQPGYNGTIIIQK